MFILGRDERRREREADAWVNDPHKSSRENWLAKRRQQFSPARGLWFFVVGLVVFSITVGISALLGELASLWGAVAFVVAMSALAGLIGMFTENVPL